jgi:uncharacterized protein with NRDE domain
MLRGLTVCLILFAVDAHPEYRLIVAANRDEFFVRPSAAAQPWAEAADVIGGRDLEKGGTWLAVRQGGRLAAVTNFRDGARKKNTKRSRGLLVSDFILSREMPRDFIHRIEMEPEVYDGFNLIVADGAEVWHYSNIERSGTRVSRGVHGVSNHLLDTPWPKVTRGKEVMAHALGETREGLIARLFEALREERRAADHQLPSTGVGLEWERVLSPAFIATAEYGTRASTVVLVHRSGALSFIERTYEGGNDAAGALRSFELPPQPVSSVTS